MLFLAQHLWHFSTEGKRVKSGSVFPVVREKRL